MHCTSALATEEKNVFESQNGVAVVQTSKIKLGGHCICNFRHIPVLLKTWVFWTVLQTRTKKKKKAGVVLSQNVVTACTLLNCRNLPCVVPVTSYVSSLAWEDICLAGLRSHIILYCEMSLITGSTAGCCCLTLRTSMKTDQVLRLCVDYSPWGRKTLAIFLSCMPVHQKDLCCKHYLYNRLPMTPPWAMLCWMEQAVFRTHKFN